MKASYLNPTNLAMWINATVITETVIRFTYCMLSYNFCNLPP